MDRVTEKKKYIHTVYLLLAIALVGAYVVLWYTREGILYSETVSVLPNWLDGGMEGLEDFIRKSFDLRVIEGGCYRPRIGAFMIEYLDIKLWKICNSSRVFGNWGGHFPLVLLGIPLILAGVSFILKSLSDTMCWQCRLLIGAGFLFSTHYQAATYVFLRTAKLLSPAVALCVIAYFLCKKEAPCAWKKDIVAGIVLSAFYTIDEQIFAVGIMLWVASVVFGYVDKKITASMTAFFVSVLSYVIYYLTWGRLVFAYFTGGTLKKHPHTYIGMIENLWEHIWDGSRVYYQAVLWIAWNSRVVLGVCVFLYIVCFILNKNVKQRLLSLYFLLFAYALSICMVSAHPPIAQYPDLPKGMYFIVTAFATVIGVFIVGISVLDKYSGSGAEKFMALLVLANCLYVLLHIEPISLNHTVQGQPGKMEYMEMLENDCIIENGITDSYFDGLIKWAE